MKLIDFSGMSHTKPGYDTVFLCYHKNSKMGLSTLALEIPDSHKVYTTAVQKVVGVAIATSPTNSQKQALLWLLNAYADQELIFQFTGANFYPNHGEPFWRIDFIGERRGPLSALVFSNLCFVWHPSQSSLVVSETYAHILTPLAAELTSFLPSGFQQGGV